jgi:HPt (histidine-containing phosphotransfer) domain-containing protein
LRSPIDSHGRADRARSRAGIYAVSASAVPDEVVAAADGFLLKPITPDALRKLQKARHAQADPSAPRKNESGVPGDVSLSLGPEPQDLVVNPETLAQLRDMMPEPAVRQIYAAIVADLAKRLSALEAAIARGDYAEVRRIGHAIKGGCGMAGALQAARLGALLESSVNHLNNSSPILGDLRAATRNLERMLEAEFPA